MGERREKRTEILKMIEEFSSDFGDVFDIRKSMSCVYGLPYNSISRTLSVSSGSDLAMSLSLSEMNGVTFAIIKPNVLRNNKVKELVEFITSNGFEVKNSKLRVFSDFEAREFYKDHKDKDFYEGLIEFMTSGPCITMVLSNGNKHDKSSIEDFRKLVGPTNAFEDKENNQDNIRGLFADSVTENAIHASDSEESLLKEILFF